ncbi:2Fe-2S iron-sulfur cluster binding domain-containing protein [candidate division WOR-3 bacterium]|nr:2Fe-2S iron-sulfur cluster binding domain-containing protein [candidate division WOR-3 bacterium]
MEPEQKMIPVYIMGEKVTVPEGSTIIDALEYAGFQLKKGIGCREGFCGACATVYRLPGEFKLMGGLACQTVVEPGMYLAQIPCTPAQKATYNIEELKPDVSSFLKLYPEVFRCVSCNSCTKICPQEIEVMDYVNAIIRGDIAEAADLSFDCIMCGLCNIRCPAEMAQYNIGILARRLCGRYLTKRSDQMFARIKEIEEGKFDKDMKEIMSLSKDELKKRYVERELNFDIT